MKKKILSYICSSLIFSVFTSIVFSAYESEKINYIALGDSIASGYVPGKVNLDKECYAYLLKADIEKCTKKRVSYENLAVSGQPTQSLILQLQNLDLSKADIITISIGSNDILIPFKNIISTSLGCMGEDPMNEVSDLFKQVQKNSLYAKYRLSRLMSILSNISNNDVIRTSMEDIKTNIDFIIKKIKEKNSFAKIILTNFYNPYECIDIQYAQQFIKSFNEMKEELNGYLESHAEENGYFIADISDLGKEEDNININLTDSENISFDPHPSNKGHEMIYEAIKSVRYNYK